ncbi:MAG: TrkA family potassium uptake protein [Epsilonproteobacteria bacterium]|nr:TrkA family potassium uptake protein [Campylobacterota bacterium]
MKNNNIILFGYGKNGKSVAKYLTKKDFKIVVYDTNEQNDAKHDGFVNVELFDDKILDSDLIEMGIRDTNVAICMLENEASNMFLALSIRNLNAQIKIIAKSGDKDYTHRYELAGVNQIINPYEITANRIESILKKPITLEFIHNIVFEDNNLSFAQIEIIKDSFLDGKYIDDLDLNKNYNIIVIGIVDKERSEHLEMISDNKLDAEDILVVIGDLFEIERLKMDMEESTKWKLA